MLQLGWQLASGLVFAAGLLFAKNSRRRTRPRKSSRYASLLGLFTICVLLGTVTCGGGGGNSNPPQSSPPAPQGGTITVQGTSGSLQRSAQITVTVN